MFQSEEQRRAALRYLASLVPAELWDDDAGAPATDPGEISAAELTLFGLIVTLWDRGDGPPFAEVFRLPPDLKREIGGLLVAAADDADQPMPRDRQGVAGWINRAAGVRSDDLAAGFQDEEQRRAVLRRLASLVPAKLWDDDDDAPVNDPGPVSGGELALYGLIVALSGPPQGNEGPPAGDVLFRLSPGIHRELGLLLVALADDVDPVAVDGWIDRGPGIPRRAPKMLA